MQSSRLTAHFTWLAHRNEKEKYLGLHEWFLNTLELMIGSIGNSIHDTLAGLYNTMENAEAIVQSPRLASLRGAFKGKPALLCLTAHRWTITLFTFGKPSAMR